jgi:selenocysteine lyase/cysteine desulfurase
VRNYRLAIRDKETKEMSTPAIQETKTKALDSAWVRAQFPSLQSQVNGRAAAFLDGPAGTQVPKQGFDAVLG